MSLRSWILQWALKNVVGSIDPWSVLTYDERSGIVKLNGEQLAKEEVRQLKTEAIAIQKFRLWTIMQETLKQKAIEKAVVQSTNFEQVLAGKLMLHNLSLQKSIVSVIEKIKVL